MNRQYRESLMGSVQQVLFETEEDGLWSGHAPNYIRVYSHGENLHNRIENVLVTGLRADGVVGQIQGKEEAL